MKNIALIGIFLLVGCVPTNVVTDAEDSQSINSVTMTCKKPYIFTQDCSIWSGATRKLSINGFDVKVAGSENGSIILVMDAHFFANSLSDPLTLNSPTHSQASNNSYYAVKKIFTQENINIQKVIPLRFLGDTNGYVLELDTDGYKTLIKYTVKKNQWGQSRLIFNARPSTI